jgi:hypothetical protein
LLEAVGIHAHGGGCGLQPSCGAFHAQRERRAEPLSTARFQSNSGVSQEGLGQQVAGVRPDAGQAVSVTRWEKSHCAQALGHEACRQGKKVRFIRAASFFRELNASRADKTWDRALKRFAAQDLLIMDDFGLTTLNFSQAEDIYELISERHLKSSFIFTSNRKIESWVDLFPDPAMGNAALDRIVSQGHAIILEGESYRRKGQSKSPSQHKQEENMTEQP